MKPIITFLLIATLATFAYSQNPQSEFIKIADDGWHFETAISRTSFVPFGANYYDPASWDTSVVWDNPQFIAPNVIGKFDSVRTRRHFAQLQQIGINIIRIFLSAKRFEPALFQLDETSFRKVDKIIELAKEHNLRIIFDLVEVWEGAPDWMSWEYYADEATLQGLEFLVSAFGQRYANEPTIFAWDLINEPHVRWSDGHMDQLWIEWVHAKYLTLDSLRAAWDDFPRPSETWRNIKVPEESINKFRDQRLFDFQLFREDVAYKWTERLVKAIRKKDPDHLTTVGLIQWSAPIKKSGDHPGSYPAFNPHKIAPLVDYISIHGYNWWDENVGTYIRGLLRFCYTNKPVLLEEFEYRNATVDETWNSASGWLAWACYQGPFDSNPEAFLFDFNENLTNSGRAFQQKALSLKGQIPSRIADAARIDADLKDLVTSAERPDSLYVRYVEAQKSLSGPLGFNILNLKPPIISSDTSGNLLRNPGFEQFNDPSGVADYWEFSPGDYIVAASFSTEARGGSRSQRIDIQSVVANSYVTLSQPQSLLKLKGKTEYKLSFWVKGRGKIVPSVILNGYNYVKWGEIFTLTNSWRNLQITFTTPEVVTSVEELIRFADAGNFGGVQAGDWVLIDDAILSVSRSANDITINLNEEYQSMTGFGAMFSFELYDCLYSYLNSTTRQEVLDLLFDDNFTMARTWIYNPIEVTNDNADPNVFNWFGFDFGGTNARMRTVWNEVRNRNPNMIFHANLNTPEAWMKDNNHLNDGHLLPTMYDEFAEWVVALLIRYRNDYGIEIQYCNIQNEPDGCNYGYPHACYTKEQMLEVVKKVGARIQREGLSTKLVIPDAGNPQNANDFATYILSDATARQYVGIIGYHSFDGGTQLSSRNAIRALSAMYGLPVWQIECGTWEWYDDSWTNGMFYANLIHDDIVEANVSTWHYGTYLLWDGHWNHSFDLIRVHSNGTYTITPRYYALKHYAKFVKNGSKRVGSSSTDSNLKVAAFKDEMNQRFTIVAINNASISRTVNFIFTPTAIAPSSFSGTRSTNSQNFQEIGSVSVVNDTLRVTLTDSSVTTFIGSLGTVSVDLPSFESKANTFELSQNYPNPFNPGTTFKYQLPKDAHVKLEIYNVLGQRVAILLDENKPAGHHKIEWNGRDDAGRQLNSGLYFVKLITREVHNSGSTEVKMRKVILIK